MLNWPRLSGWRVRANGDSTDGGGPAEVLSGSAVGTRMGFAWVVPACSSDSDENLRKPLEPLVFPSRKSKLDLRGSRSRDVLGSSKVSYEVVGRLTKGHPGRAGRLVNK